MRGLLTILIGLPRSGKSTLAHHRSGVLDESGGLAVVVSADDFFTGPDGYRFDPALLGEAHADCFRRCLDAMDAGHDVIVDNTNLSNWERAPYVLAAQARGYRVCFVRMSASAEECAARPDNGHGVPADAIRRMEERLEPVLPFWPGADCVEVL